MKPVTKLTAVKTTRAAVVKHKGGTFAKPPTCMTDIRDELLAVYAAVRDDQMSLDKSMTLACVAGRVIASARAQLEYAVAREERPKISFLA